LSRTLAYTAAQTRR